MALITGQFCMIRHLHYKKEKCDLPHDPRLGLCIFGDKLDFYTGLCCNGHSAYGFGHHSAFKPPMVACIIYKNILERNKYKMDDEYNKMLNQYNYRQIRYYVFAKNEIENFHDTIIALTKKIDKLDKRDDDDKKYKKHKSSDNYYHDNNNEIITKLNEQIKKYEEEHIEQRTYYETELKMASLKIKLLLNEIEKLNKISEKEPSNEIMTSMIVRNSELVYNYETIEKRNSILSDEIEKLKKEISDLKKENNMLKEKYKKIMDSLSEL